MAVKLHHLPPRLACGAFILNTGISKRSLDVEAATGLRDQATNAYPVLKNVDPVRFGKALSTFEIVLGLSLLVPRVPTWVGAAGLSGFSAALMGVYLKTPGMTREDGIRPAPAGMGIARDIFMLGSGLGLVIEELTTRRR
ncbi:membrane protein [Actinotalea ferrariae]|nr:membrane protein [Actinotalea ferrariae]